MFTMNELENTAKKMTSNLNLDDMKSDYIKGQVDYLAEFLATVSDDIYASYYEKYRYYLDMLYPKH